MSEYLRIRSAARFFVAMGGTLLRGGFNVYVTGCWEDEPRRWQTGQYGKSTCACPLGAVILAEQPDVTDSASTSRMAEKLFGAHYARGFVAGWDGSDYDCQGRRGYGPGYKDGVTLFEELEAEGLAK